MYKLQKLTSVISVLSLVVMLALPVAAVAADIFGIEDAGTATGLGSSSDPDFKLMIGNLIKSALGFLGIIALIIILIGGFKYMTAGGAEEKVKGARKWIISGVIGMAIILTSYAITYYVLNTMQTVIQES